MSEHFKVKIFSASALFGVALLAVVAPLQAQATHAQWLPWVGCWTPVGQGDDAPLLCVTPGEDPASVEFVTIAEGEVVSREVARADGQPADDDQEGCEGTTTWTFSNDGHRAYHRSEHVCDGEVGRVATGMMAMASRTEWMDLNSVEVAGRTTPWAQRYRLADRETAEAAGFGDLEADRAMAIRAARQSANALPTVDAVIEAANVVHPETVEAWLVERAPRFNLDGDKLVRMADAGVPSHVLDVVVAVSYPNRFRLRPDEDETGGLTVAEARTRRADRDRYGYDMYRRYSSPFGFGFSPYGSYAPYGYGLGYGGYGYGGGYGYRPVIIDVEPRVENHGRVVSGRGYRSGGGSGTDSASSGGGSSTRSAPASSRGSSSGRTARRRGGGS